MINDFINMLEKTGSYNRSIPEFSLLRLPQEYNCAFENKESRKALYEVFDNIESEIPCFLVTRSRQADNLKLIHVTDIKNYNSITKEGLKISKNSNIPDLGKGIYAIRNIKYSESEEFAFDGYIHIRDWVLDMHKAYSWDSGNYDMNLEETIICVVEFDYSGIYQECIYGEDHVGYISIESDIPPEKINVSQMSLKDFFSNY